MASNLSAANGGEGEPGHSRNGGSGEEEGLLLWSKGPDGKALIHDVEEETRTKEPSCLSILKDFNLKDYVVDSFTYYKQNPACIRHEILSGITLALIEVPESVAFAFMAGVNPYMGMASVFWIGTITGLFGGRPAMISGAAGAMAVVLGDLTKDDGPLAKYSREQRVEQLLMCVFLIGVLEILAGPILCEFVKIIPQPAMIGFMDALAIIIARAQLEAFQVCTTPDTLFNGCGEHDKAWLSLKEGKTWTLLFLVLLTLLIMWGLPRIKRIGHIIPASLMAIVVGTAVEWGINRPLLHAATRTVGETARLGSGLPGFHWPDLPPSPAWGPILGYAVSLTMIGLIETVMTHEVVNSLVKDAPNSFASKQECFTQGIANLVCGLFGAIGGSALIGETVINVLHGAKGRLSCVTAGLTMLGIMEGLSEAVALMPVAVLAGVIFSVALHTMQWKNLIQLHRLPRHDVVIIVVVTALSVATNLAIGVAVGVALSSIYHVYSTGMSLNAKASVGKGPSGEPRKVYHIFYIAPVFFGSTRPLLRVFDYDQDPDDVIVDLQTSSILDLSGITALNEAGKRYEELGKDLTVVGLNPQSLAIIRRCPDQRSHLHIPALPPPSLPFSSASSSSSLTREEEDKEVGKGKGGDLVPPPHSHARPASDRLTLGPEGIEVGLEMGLSGE